MAIIKKDSRTLITTLLWIIVQSILLIKNGIVTSGEAAKYISEATQLLNTGSLSSSNYWFYSVEIFLILLDKLLGAKMIFVIGVHLVLSFFATISFKKLTSQLFSETTAMACTIVFLLNYPYHEFTSFAQTESVYFSLSIILSYYLLTLQKLSIKAGIVISLITVILIFTRPTGILSVIPTGLFLFARFWKTIDKRSVILTAASGLVFLWVVLNSAIGSGGQLDFMLPFKTDQVICGVKEVFNSNINIIKNGNSVFGIVYYLTNNFSHFAHLASKKTISFFGLTRSYFSVWHNLFLAIFFYPLYLFIILSVRKWIKKQKIAFIYFFTLISITWITALLTCDDWHNRFFLAIAPYIIILAIPITITITSAISSSTFFRNRY